MITIQSRMSAITVMFKYNVCDVPLLINYMFYIAKYNIDR